MNELDRLRDAHRLVPDPTPGARSRVVDGLPGGRRRSPARVLVPAGVLAAVATLGIALQPASRPAPSQRSGDSKAAFRLAGAEARERCARRGAAASCLQAVAAVAGLEPPASGQVLYRRDRVVDAVQYRGPDGRPQASPTGEGTFAVALPADQELWLAPDGRARASRGEAGEPFLPSVADRRAWRAAGSPPIDDVPYVPAGEIGADPTRDYRPEQVDALLLGSGSLNEVLPADPFRSLSRDPAQLERTVLRMAWRQRVEIADEPRCAPDLSDCPRTTRRNILSQFGSDLTLLLRDPRTPADLREALWRVLARVDGVRLLGPLTDPLDRRGVALLLPDPVNDGSNVVLFDPAGARLLAQGRSEDGTLGRLRWQELNDVVRAKVAELGRRP
jgi:hypothetical protein